MNLAAAIIKINKAFDARINAKANQSSTTQAELDSLVAEKEERIRIVREYIQAENDKVRIDEILANKPSELV